MSEIWERTHYPALHATMHVLRTGMAVIGTSVFARAECLSFLHVPLPRIYSPLFALL